MTKELYEILTKPKNIKFEIKRTAERIDDLRLMMLPSAIRYDKDKVISSPSDPMGKYIENLEKYETQLKNLMDDYVDARDRMFVLVDALENSTQKDIIQGKYMNEWKFYKIAEEIGYSEMQTYRIYADAIEALEKMLVNVSK